MIRKICTPLILSALLVAAEARAFEFFEPVIPPRPFQVIVHRGMAHQAPENTRPALQRVAEDGFEWAEVDVRLTKDGHHVIFHDSTLDGKSDGKGKVSDLTLDQIQKLDTGAWFAQRYAGQHMLTFKECLDLAKGKMNLYLDCKDINPDLLVAEILDAGMEKQVIVFDELNVLARVHEKSKGRVPVMPKWHPKFGAEDWIAKWHPDAVEINADEVTLDICRMFHAKGVKVQAKVLDNDDKVEVWDRMLDAGIDWLQTDLPEEIIAHRLWQKLEHKPVMISCHRGANRYAPENTIAAFEKAIRLGVDYVEYDVRTASDGKFFILHDGAFNRTTGGKGPLAEADTAQIRSLDAGAWFGKPFVGQKIPTLQEMYDTLDGHVNLYYDAKAIAAESLAHGLEEMKQVDRCVVYQSPSFLASLRKINPAIRGLCPLGKPEEIDKWNETCHPYAFDTKWDILSKELIDRCHALNIKVFSDAMGGHEKVEDYRQAIEWGIDLIQTDHPLRVMRAVELITSKK